MDPSQLPSMLYRWRVRVVFEKNDGAQDDAREGDANKLLVAFGTVRSGRSVGHVQSATMAGRTFLRRLALASLLGAGAFAASLLHRPTICEVALAARRAVAHGLPRLVRRERLLDRDARAVVIDAREAAVEHDLAHRVVVDGREVRDARRDH